MVVPEGETHDGTTVPARLGRGGRGDWLRCTHPVAQPVEPCRAAFPYPTDPRTRRLADGGLGELGSRTSVSSR